MTTNTKVIVVPIGDVYPDEHQPRKLFEPSKMASLQKSMTKFGMKQPLIVEKIGNKYLIEDGERRYRSAKDLGWKDVPVIVSEAKSTEDRLIEQFHIQEQHEGWTGTEKASSVAKIADHFGLSFKQICEMFSLDDKTARRYISFYDLTNKKEYERNELGLNWAYPITLLRKYVKKLTLEVLEQEFTHTDEKDFESAIITRIKKGQFTKTGELLKIRDAFKKDPKMIRKFIDSAISPDAIFIETKAKGAYHLRNAMNSASYMKGHIHKFLQIKDIKLDDKNIQTLKSGKKAIEELLELVGE